MEDKKLKEVEKQVNKLLKEWQQKNYDGVILVRPERDGRVQFGVVADEVSIVPLVETMLKKLEENLHISYENLCVYLATTKILRTIAPEGKDSLYTADVETLERVAEIMRKIVNAEILDVLMDKAINAGGSSSTVH
jgi:hypothetical protein